jgi:protein MpaA
MTAIASTLAIVTLLLGRSEQGRPIYAERVGDPHGTRVLVVGCIHGNECAGIPIVQALARAHARVDLWLVPNLNPDGFARGTRNDANDVNLNADWRAFRERETRIGRNLILRIHPRITIWYHQHLDLVWAYGASTAAGRLYARLAGLRFYHHRWVDGGATEWQNRHVPGTAAFTVELPAGTLSPAQVRLHVRAVLALATHPPPVPS